MNDKDWTLVYSDSPLQAELIKQMLNNLGIEVVVLNKQDSSYQTFGDAEVFVKKENKDKALKHIKEFKD
ncbi:MAG TPA: DUF2007 domain-containing protein [Perlabentimonas sp.]|jgi:ABC-type transport system substrate-binding protein|nr:DUF2007 domain-containing protein [Bacteroidales bacterium]MDD4672853.1 DUF2007 domain-containing protein [Bacteroidales bacterium]MDY0347311.1 DUF2007 domain-containing protein [Tenuifilaceae bacterium]HZJ73941.1 DUF2007 domain-containing protein [Perlabentimonas sp.]